MFAGGFLRARLIRRAVSSVAALLAAIGGVFVLLAAAGQGLAAAIVPAILGIGALLSAWWIYHGGKALLFPRARLTMSGFVAVAAGALLYVVGFGLDAYLVIAGGILAWLATIL